MLVASLACLVCLVLRAEAVDGKATVSSGQTSWNAFDWKDGVVAGGGGSASLYLQSQTTLTINEPLDLGRLDLERSPALSRWNKNNSGGYGASFTIKRGTSSLHLSGDAPVVSATPCVAGKNLLTLNGDSVLAGDAGTVLTLVGGNYRIAGGTTDGYALTGFRRVDLDGVSVQTDEALAGGFTDGDVRLSGAWFNLDHKTDIPVIGGNLIVGPGKNSIRLGVTSSFAFGGAITREGKGLLAVDLNNHVFTLGNPADYIVNAAEGRFPTWMLMNDYSFITYDDENRLVAATIDRTTFSGCEQTETVHLTSATTLSSDAEAAAVRVDKALTVNEGVTLTLGNAREPGLLVVGDTIKGGGDVTFVGPEGIIASRSGKAINARLTGTNSISVHSGAAWTQTTTLGNAGNTFSGGLDLFY